MRVLIITSEWPTKFYPNDVPFLVDNIRSIQEHGIYTDVLKVDSGSIYSQFNSIWKIKNKLSLKPYDLIHTHFGWNGLIGIWFDKPHIISFHGSDLNHPNRWTIRTIIIHIISQLSTLFSTRNIFVSDSLVNRSIRKSINPNIIPMGVNLEKFKLMDKNESRRQLNLSLDKKIILFGGNKSQPVKRVILAQKAMAQLGDDYKLITIDYENHDKIPLYLNAVDALLMTSESEGSPMMVKEALACNLPIISTDVGDVKSMISGLDNCHIINNESPVSIAKIVEECISNGIHPVGRDKIKKNYSVEAIADQVINVYKDVLNKTF